MKEWTNIGTDKHRMLILSYTVQLVIPMFIPIFIILAIMGPDKYVTEISCERKWRERKIDKQTE